MTTDYWWSKGRALHRLSNCLTSRASATPTLTSKGARYARRLQNKSWLPVSLFYYLGIYTCQEKFISRYSIIIIPVRRSLYLGILLYTRQEKFISRYSIIYLSGEVYISVFSGQSPTCSRREGAGHTTAVPQTRGELAQSWDSSSSLPPAFWEPCRIDWCTRYRSALKMHQWTEKEGRSGRGKRKICTNKPWFQTATNYAKIRFNGLDCLE